MLDAGIAAGKIELFGEHPKLKGAVASALISPTRIYVKPLLNVIRDFEVHGMVHVTGGGFEGNIPRVLPAGVTARIDTQAWPRPGVFDWISELGELPESEMLRVFNCGIGMIVVVGKQDVDDVIQRLSGLGERAYRIGVTERRAEGDPALVIDPGFLQGD